MDVNDLKSLSAEVKKRMDSAIEHVRKELGGLRTGGGGPGCPRRFDGGPASGWWWWGWCCGVPPAPPSG